MKIHKRIVVLTLVLWGCFTCFALAGPEISSEDVKCIKVNVMEGERFGYILRSSGKWVIPPRFLTAKEFQANGLAVAGEDKKLGLIDLHGQPVGSQEYQSISAFQDGFAVVKENGKFGIINAKGEVVLASKYDNGEIAFSEQLAAVRINGKYGFVDTSDQMVIAPQFEQAFPFHEGLAVVKLQGKYGFIDKSGRFVIEPQYESAGAFSGGLAQAGLAGKTGFIDKSGTVVIPMQFQSAFPFQNGLAVVEWKGNFGYIDRAGKWVVEPKYELAFPHKDGLALVSVNGRHGFIDNKGNQVIPCELDPYPRWEGQLIKTKIGEKTGYMDASGKWTVQSGDFLGTVSDYWQKQGIVTVNGEYYDRNGKKLNHYANYLQDAYEEMRLEHYDAAVNLFSMASAINPNDKAATWGSALAKAKKETREQYRVAGTVVGEQQNALVSGDDIVAFSVVTEAGNKFGYLRRDTGRWVILPQFDEAGSFHDGLAQVKYKGKYGFIRLDGTFAVKPDFDRTWFYFKEGLTSVQLHGSYGFVDTQGNLVVKPQFGYALLYSEGLAHVSYNGNYGFIDKQGKFAIPPKFEYASDFVDGLAPVEIDRKWGFIDKAGQLVIPCIYENGLANFSEGLASVKLNGKYGFIDQTGRMVIAPQYDYADSFHDGRAIVKNNNLVGVIDREGQYVVHPSYDLISAFKKGIAKVKLNSRFGYIDTTGQEVIPVQFERVEHFPELAMIEAYGNQQWGVMSTSGTWIDGPIRLTTPVNQYWPRQKILVVNSFYYGQDSLSLLDHYGNHMKKAYWHSQRGDSLQATHSFEAALRINPGDIGALWGLSQIRAKEIYLQSGLEQQVE